jgi:trans-AT polyketide synthase/acyltransferase/oxidoreductase domain-containing protein
MTVLERKPPSHSTYGSSQNLTPDRALDLIGRVSEPLWLTRRPNGDIEEAEPGDEGASFAPPCHPSAFGDSAFRASHGLRFNYVTGAMANGIASTKVVEAAAHAGGLGFFGSAGLSIGRVSEAIDELQTKLSGKPFGVNFIHSPNESNLEDGLCDLLLKRGVGLVEASAFLDLTLPIVRFRLAGIARGADGSVRAPNRVVAKVSRVEVGTKFLSPPPDAMLWELVNRGAISSAQAELARAIPIADDLTAEADSGGHTDNRPAIALIPTMIALRDRLQSQFKYATAPRIGAAGGISTPASVAAAYAMGAAYVVTGSVNQACVEAGTSETVRKMLAEAQQADVVMAPAADMFEMGVKVQVLKRGTMFAMRGAKLYEIFHAHPSIEAIPADVRLNLEKTVFKNSLDAVWDECVRFFTTRDPKQLEKAAANPKHKMALVFRWYLGMASRWANSGEPGRQMDYQVWCGPAMGAFNEWTKDSFLARPEERTVEAVALNLLYHAAVLTRLHTLKLQGFAAPSEWERRTPLSVDELRSRLA